MLNVIDDGTYNVRRIQDMARLSLLYPEERIACKDDQGVITNAIEELKINLLVLLQDNLPQTSSMFPLERYLTKDPNVIQYRLDILEDIMEQPKIYQLFQEIVPKINDINEIMRVRHLSDDSMEHILAISELEIYVDLIEKIYAKFNEAKVQSAGLKALKNFVDELATSEAFVAIKRQLEKTSVCFNNFKSVTVGINLDANFHPKEAGIISINTEEYRAGDFVERLLRGERTKGEFTCMTPMIPVKKGLEASKQEALIMAMNAGVYSILKKALKTFPSSVHNYMNQQLTMLCNLREDFLFFTAAAKFLHEMKDYRKSVVKPEICAKEDKVCEFVGLYHPFLVEKLKGLGVVTNDLKFDSNGRIFIVTGPNQGGKSVLSHGVAIAQVLFQLGIFVPATKARLSPVDQILIYLPTNLEVADQQSRFAIECSKLKNLMNQVTEQSFVMFDEPLSGTNGTEAAFIAGEILTALGIRGCRGLFITHIYEVTKRIDEYNSHEKNRSKIDNLVAQMEETTTGERSFKLIRTTPDGKSYAKDIAKKYGLLLENLMCEDM